MIDFGYGVSLDRIRLVDLEILRQWRNDYRIWRWCRQNDLISEIDQDAWYERQAKDPSISMYKILDKNECIGVCGLTSIDYINRRGEFSLYIAPKYQTFGFSKMALKTLFRHGFSNIGLNRIWGETFEGNFAASLFEGMGMKKEGTRKEFYFRDGDFIDADLYSINSKLFTKFLESEVPQPDTP